MKNNFQGAPQQFSLEKISRGPNIMCLAVPMKLVEMTGEGSGRVDSGGVGMEVSLIMTPHAKVGDYLIVHAGFGIEILDQNEATIRLDLFRELAAATAGPEES